MLFAIGVLRSLGERSLQHNKYLYICFIDYKNAFDNVNWYKLMRALVWMGVDWRDRRLICKSYMCVRDCGSGYLWSDCYASRYFLTSGYFRFILTSGVGSRSNGSRISLISSSEVPI